MTPFNRLSNSPSARLSRRGLLRVALGGGCLLLAACAVGPDYKRPETAAPTGYKETPDTAATATPVLATDWWTLFGDEDLNRLADEVLRANLDIQAALARVDQARALSGSARGSFFPSLSVDPSVRRARTSGGATATAYSLPLDLSYEIDIWGRLRRQYESYHNLEQASAADFAVVRQTAIADLAQGYFTLRAYDSGIDILTRTLELYHRQLDLTQQKFKVGLALRTDVLDAQNQIDAAETKLIEAQRTRVKQEHAIAILVGKAPADFSIPAKVVDVKVPVIPAGLPATLLSRRPDVAEAEHKLIAANARIGVAKADFYPTLSLTGSAGYQSIDVSSLTNWESRVWSISPGLSLPIFQGGKLTAELAGAKAQYEELLADYRSTVLGAYRDVEDQLSDLRFLAREATSLDQTLLSAEENVRLREQQYKQGLSSSLDVISSNQTLLATQNAILTAQNNRLAATVLLMKALGGGWDPAQPVEAPESGKK